MKSMIFLTALLLGMCYFCVAQTSSISGRLIYDNNQQTLIHDSAIVYLYQGQVLVSQDTIHSDGSYLFENIALGSYTLKTSCNKKWGGGNAIDSYLILCNFVGLFQIPSGLKYYVADVNGSGGIPASADELAIVRRWGGMIWNFLPPCVPPPGRIDWLSIPQPITVEADTIYQKDIKILCNGDVNGSYIPY
ncbi:MAG: hypothetical protein NTU44_11275 [Bacteroidetes bacterium]|nr:hypothetical protein [Bacteroidota bacterium]